MDRGYDNDSKVAANGAPLQAVSWAEKYANDQEWFKLNIDYGIGTYSFGSPLETSTGQDLSMLYDVYNSRFPASWFEEHTNPLNAKEDKHKKFPAKIRPISILRTNIDLLMAEYPRRPFVFQVNNMGDDGYSSFMEELNKKMESSITQFFQLALQRELMAQGLMGEDGQPVSEEAQAEVEKQMQEFDTPDQIKQEFTGSYRDKVAIKAQKWLTRALREHSIRPKLLEMFKDWLITGQVRSYKGILHGNLVYERISPMEIRNDATKYIEDAENVVALRWMSRSEVTDRFYEQLKEKDVKRLDAEGNMFYSPEAFNGYLGKLYEGGAKIPVWHRQWTGRRKMGILSRVDPMTGEPEQIEVDEDYTADKELGESIEWMWVNEKYEGWRVGRDLYLDMGPVPYQRNSMNNFSYCKGSYNGRNYSDTHSMNISAMEMGIPCQILYLIVNRTLELTIAKSKGKIILIDKAAIPRGNGWNEEKFFYYAEALGYALMDRNQQGVDKSMNQYQVLDMSLFDNIQQLIQLLEAIKQQWDDILGINRQRKGQTYASDGQGVNERAVFQSTVITDMIYNLFEEFVEKELQGLIDLSRFTNMDGVRKMWYSTEVGNEILEINPEEYCNADLGVFVENATEAIQIKNKMEAQAQAMIQNEVKPSTMVEIFQAQNIAELKSKLKEVERIQASIAEQAQQQEAQQAEDLDKRQEGILRLQNELKAVLVNLEYDRKEDIEDLKGMYSTFTFQDGDSNDNGVPDAVEVAQMRLDRDKFVDERQQKMADRALKNKEIDSKERAAGAGMEQKERQHQDKMKLAKKKAAQTKKK